MIAACLTAVVLIQEYEAENADDNAAISRMRNALLSEQEEAAAAEGKK